MAVEAEAEDGEVEAQGARRGLSKRLLIMGAAALIVLLAGGGALYFFVFAGRGAEADKAHVAAADSFIFNLPTMTVNLASDANSPGDQFLKLTVALEVSDESVMKEIQPRMAKVIDAFQVYLRELRKTDLEGSAGIYRLKEELRRRINVAIFPAQVDSILFKEILVQ